MRQVVDGRYTARMDGPFAVYIIGMRVNKPRGLRTLLRFGPKISKSVADQPDGLLLHENMIFSVVPPHGGMRQYWQDFESLERWARSLPHKEWWASFVRDTGGTGFWHEVYFMRGGMEAVYLDIAEHPLGFLNFAPAEPARGAMFSARSRLKAGGETKVAGPVSEDELYDRG